MSKKKSCGIIDLNQNPGIKVIMKTISKKNTSLMSKTNTSKKNIKNIPQLLIEKPTSKTIRKQIDMTEIFNLITPPIVIKD